MKRSEAALGASKGAFGFTKEKEPATTAERLAALEKRMDDLIRAFNSSHSGTLARKRSPIPSGTILYGNCSNGQFMCVVTDGGVYIGNIRYNSLSAAAEAVSGVRRSGWTFWKTETGQTAKEAFAKK